MGQRVETAQATIGVIMADGSTVYARKLSSAGYKQFGKRVKGDKQEEECWVRADGMACTIYRIPPGPVWLFRYFNPSTAELQEIGEKTFGSKEEAEAGIKALGLTVQPGRKGR